jgi:hypothetical protein
MRLTVKEQVGDKQVKPVFHPTIGRERQQQRS